MRKQWKVSLITKDTFKYRETGESEISGVARQKIQTTSVG